MLLTWRIYFPFAKNWFNCGGRVAELGRGSSLSLRREGRVDGLFTSAGTILRSAVGRYLLSPFHTELGI